MYEAQGGRCKLCSKRNRKLCVDHNHDTGEVRGLLCNGCNLKLGWVEKHVDTIWNYLHMIQ